MYTGCNKTALCSQKSIAEAFVSLLHEKEYSKISVSEICEKAAVSRQTFYSLFKAKENIVAFELSKKYLFNPNEECKCTGRPSLRELSKAYARFISDKSDFINLLVKNNIIYLMQEGLYECFLECIRKDDNWESDLAADFLAAGLSTIAKHYVANESAITDSELEEIIYDLFTGKIYLE